MNRIIKSKFETIFLTDPLIVVAPGRINLIGEHTDYNEGFVLPASIDKHIVFAVGRNDENKFRFVANDLNDDIELPVDNIKPVKKQWVNYLLGVIAQLSKMGKKITGVDCVFGGNIPLGAGLSSSAALETGFAFALNKVFNLGLTKIELVKLSQKAEHEYAGVMCGIMDQFASVFGQKDKVIRLDCRSLEYELFPLKLDKFKIILCDTHVKHTLASSEYNTRRKECEEGVTLLKDIYPEIKSLRDVSLEILNKHKVDFDPVVYRRCRFVVEENTRLLEACTSLAKNNLKHFGELMYQTHNGLKNDYEVSCRELDILVDIAKESGMVLGARMMGGGFGGCTINIVEIDKTQRFIDRISKEYKTKTDIDMPVYQVSIEEGTNILAN
jgi:galactokinase